MGSMESVHTRNRCVSTPRQLVPMEEEASDSRARIPPMRRKVPRSCCAGIFHLCACVRRGATAAGVAFSTRLPHCRADLDRARVCACVCVHADVPAQVKSTVSITPGYAQVLISEVVTSHMCVRMRDADSLFTCTQTHVNARSSPCRPCKKMRLSRMRGEKCTRSSRSWARCCRAHIRTRALLHTYTPQACIPMCTCI
jgi:hypothetical protein